MTPDLIRELIDAINRNTTATREHVDTMNRMLPRDQNLEALNRISDALDRFIMANSNLHGILTRSEEMRALEREREETIRGTEKSNQKILALLKEV